LRPLKDRQTEKLLNAIRKRSIGRVARNAAIAFVVTATLALAACAPVIESASAPIGAVQATHETGGGQGAGISTEATVTSIIDGDTFHALVNGADVKVRLIGVNCPEVSHPGFSAPAPYEDQGQAATAYTAAWLAQAVDKKVYLVTYPDIAYTDKYGRVLAYVYLDGSKGADADVSASLSASLAADGYAEYMKVQDYPGLGYLKEAADAAKAKGIGLWPSGCFD